MITILHRLTNNPAHTFLAIAAASALFAYLGQSFGMVYTVACSMPIVGCVALLPMTYLSDRQGRPRRARASHPRPARQQLCANRILERIAGHLHVAVGRETMPGLAEAPLSFAWYEGWLIDVFFDGGSKAWVLILSRTGSVATRSFEGNETRNAAEYVRRFAKDAAYRGFWLRHDSPPQKSQRGHQWRVARHGAA